MDFIETAHIHLRPVGLQELNLGLLLYNHLSLHQAQWFGLISALEKTYAFTCAARRFYLLVFFSLKFTPKFFSVSPPNPCSHGYFLTMNCYKNALCLAQCFI